MNTLTKTKFPEARANNISIQNNQIVVDLTDGRIIHIPLDYFPRLVSATPSELNDWRLIGDGVGIHWNKIDEDILVEALLR